MNTPFDDAVVPTPGAQGNHEGLNGGYPLDSNTPNGQGLIQTPFDEAIVKPGNVSERETRSSELGLTPTLTNVKDAPAGAFSGASAIDKMAERPNMTIHPEK